MKARGTCIVETFGVDPRLPEPRTKAFADVDLADWFTGEQTKGLLACALRCREVQALAFHERARVCARGQSLPPFLCVSVPSELIHISWLEALESSSSLLSAPWVLYCTVLDINRYHHPYNCGPHRLVHHRTASGPVMLLTMRFNQIAAAATAAAAALVSLVEGQTSSTIITGDGPPAPSLSRTAALGSWTPKPAIDGLAPASLDGMGRTIYINSASDFCLLMPPDPTKQNLVDAEAVAVAYCTNPVNGSRPMPDKLIKTAHFRRTPSYVQISGTYDPAVMNLGSNDCGGEYDSEGAEGIGNPAGVTMRDGNYFTQFLGACDIPGKPVFCLRMCPSYEYCRNTFDLMGCLWNQPGDYDEPQAFTNCDANADLPIGVYNSSYTFRQGMSVTPPPVTPPASSNCQTVASPTGSGVTYTWNQNAAAAPAPATLAGSSTKSGGSSNPSSGSAGGNSGSGSKSGAGSMAAPLNVFGLGATVAVGFVVGGALLV